MSTRNQISGSITFDVASLADAIATRLQQPAPATPGPIPLSLHEAATQLSSALAHTTGAQDFGHAAQLTDILAAQGITFVRHPRETPPAPDLGQDWFSRRNDL